MLRVKSKYGILKERNIYVKIMRNKETGKFYGVYKSPNKIIRHVVGDYYLLPPCLPRVYCFDSIDELKDSLLNGRKA